MCFCSDGFCSLDLQDCMYLHELGDGAGSFTKDDMQAGLVFLLSFFSLLFASFVFNIVVKEPKHNSLI